MKQALLYSLKVWLTAALIGPLVAIPILIVVDAFHFLKPGASGKSDHSMIYLYFNLSFLLLIGTIIPWLITLIFLKRITSSVLSVGIMKLIIGVIVSLSFGVMLLVGTVSFHSGGHEATVGFLAATIATALALWFYKLNPAVTPMPPHE